MLLARYCHQYDLTTEVVIDDLLVFKSLGLCHSPVQRYTNQLGSLQFNKVTHFFSPSDPRVSRTA